jgi:hypothetical protein
MMSGAPDEQRALARYVGGGGLANAFLTRRLGGKKIALGLRPVEIPVFGCICGAIVPFFLGQVAPDDQGIAFALVEGNRMFHAAVSPDDVLLVRPKIETQAWWT